MSASFRHTAGPTKDETPEQFRERLENNHAWNFGSLRNHHAMMLACATLGLSLTFFRPKPHPEWRGP